MLTEWKPLYLKYTDKKNTRTTAVIDQAYNIIDQVITYDQTRYILDRIAVSTQCHDSGYGSFQHSQKEHYKKQPDRYKQNPFRNPYLVTLQSLGRYYLGKMLQPTAVPVPVLFLMKSDSVQYSYLIGTVPPTSPSAEGMIRDLSARIVQFLGRR